MASAAEPRKKAGPVESAKPAGSRKKADAASWFARFAFALVFAINVQCAVSFILWPQGFMGSYELSGVPGQAAVQGIGVAFLMWNVTYPVVIASPRRFTVVAVIVLVQQVVGLVGETAILLGLPAGHAILSAAITRFIMFDAAGLVLMLAATIALAVTAAAARKQPRITGASPAE